VRLADVLDSVLAQTAPQARSLDIEISVDQALLRVELLCDGAQVERVLLNLIFNALDATGAKGQVWIRAGERRPDDGFFPIVVEDNGPGIDPANEIREEDHRCGG